MKKRMISIIFTLLLIIGAETVSADSSGQTISPTLQTAGDLLSYWDRSYGAYPDYVCGIWSTDGGMARLTIGVQKNAAGEAGKKEILELIRDDSTVTFVEQTYSRNYLLEIQEKLYPYYEKELGMVFTSLNEMDNRIDVGIAEKSRDNTDTQEMVDEIVSAYGDAVLIEYTDAVFDLTLGQKKPAVEGWYVIAFIGVVGTASLGIALIFAVRKRSALLQTNVGKTITKSPSITAKEVERLVADTAPTVPAELEERVMQAISEKEKEIK